MAETVGQRHTDHSFGRDTGSHAGDQFAARNGGSECVPLELLYHSV
jgi:hypothetical protein